jgi:hypothetical protein
MPSFMTSKGLPKANLNFAEESLNKRTMKKSQEKMDKRPAKAALVRNPKGHDIFSSQHSQKFQIVLRTQATQAESFRQARED